MIDLYRNFVLLKLKFFKRKFISLFSGFFLIFKILYIVSINAFANILFSVIFL